MVQAVSLDTLALAGALVASLFAGLTFAFARRRDATPAPIWWAAAFAAEALRLALMSAASFPPSARAELISEGGHALVAISLLIGALGFFGEAPRTRSLLALAGLPVLAMLAGLLDPRATEPAVAVLTVLAAGALAPTAWLFWRHYRAERQAWILGAAATPALLALYLLGNALRSLGYGLPFERLPSGEWDLLVHLALPLLTITSLVFVTQRRTYQVRLEAEDWLAASEQRFRDIAEVAGNWIWETGPDLRYTYFSQRLQQATGLDPADLLGKTRRELLGGDPQDPALRGHLADLDARRPFRDFEFAFHRGMGHGGEGHGGEGHGGEGRPRHLRISGKPIFDAQGVFLGYRGTGTDITAEVEAKEAAARLDRRLHDALECLPYSIALFDAQDRLVFCNSKHRTLYPETDGIMVPGRSFEETLRATAERGLYPLEGSELEAFIQDRLARHNDPPDKPIQQPLRNGRWVQISENKTADGGTVTAWSDITWLRRREQALALLVASDRDDRSFFDVAAEALVLGLGYRWSGIGYLRDDKQFEALARRGPGWPEEGSGCGLDVTPGGRVIASRGYLSFTDRVAERFPGDTILAEFGAVSYQGQAFLDAEGNPIGHVFAMNDQPDEPGPHDRALVGLIARWVGAEFEQSRIKAALAESEQRFRDYAATGADWFWETDMEQRYTHRMESEAAITSTHINVGKTREEVHRGMNAVPELAPIIADYMAKGEAFRNLEFRCDDPELGTRWIRISGRPVLAPDGRPVGYRGTGRDVTAHHEAIAAVREGERHVRSIVENVADALVTIDERGTIQSINPATERLFGYAADELIGDNVAVLMPAPHRIEHDNYIRRYIATGTASILGISARAVAGQRKDGSPVDLELTASEMWHGGDRLFIGIMRDITERKAAEETLRQKTSFVELSKSVAAAANEALSVEDALQTCVSEVCTHFGWPIGHAYLLAEDGTDELVPSTIWHLADREKFGAFRSITMATRFAPGIGLPGRILVSREPLWIADVTEDSNFPRLHASENIGIKAAYGVPVLVGSEVAAVLEFFAEEAIEPDQAALEVMAHIGKQIGRVIERARAERQLLAAKDTAERADRAKGEFLATISHELRTPLNAIIGFSEVMGQELFGPMGHPNYKEYSDDIRTSGTHLLNIINDILDVSKAQAGMIVLSDDTVDLAEVVESCLRLLGPQAEEQGISLEADLAPKSFRVRGDRQRLNQILLNLLSNAIKFTAEGSVTVRLRGNREMGVVLEVIDTGIGIAERDLERVMEPFTQVDSTLSRAHEGTGLGLPLSRILVELHDGVLTIESTFGRGTVATVRLPGKRVMGRADAA